MSGRGSNYGGGRGRSGGGGRGGGRGRTSGGRGGFARGTCSGGLSELTALAVYNVLTHNFITHSTSPGSGGRGGFGSKSEPNTPMKQRSNDYSRPNSNSRSSTPQNRYQNYNDRSGGSGGGGAPKRDGDKGASAHTVSEEYRIQLTQLLMRLRENDNEESITLPADLTNTQRKFVHELSKQLGLKSKSYGKGEARKVVVSKVKGGGLSSIIADGKGDGGDLPTEKEYKQVPRINVGRKGEEALKRHLSKFPPSKKEEAEARETGSSLLFRDDDDREGNENLGGDSAMEEAMSALLTLKDFEQSDATNDEDANAEYRQKQKANHDRMLQQRSQSHKQAQKATKAHPQYRKMMDQRMNLPAFGYAKDICSILRNKRNQVVILTGDTGCG